MIERKTILNQIKGLTPVDPKALEKFEQEMTENVIPDIVRDVEESIVLAAESRFRELEILVDRRK